MKLLNGNIGIILGKFIKDLSSETRDTETYLYVRDNISKYQLDININSKVIKNKMIEVATILTFRFLFYNIY